MAIFTGLGALSSRATFWYVWSLRAFLGFWGLWSLWSTDCPGPAYREHAAGNQVVIHVQFQAVSASANRLGEDMRAIGAAPLPSILTSAEFDVVEVPYLGPGDTILHAAVRKGRVYTVYCVGEDGGRIDRFVAVADLGAKGYWSYLHAGRGRNGRASCCW